MRDGEDIINSVIAYLTEIEGVKSRINNKIDEINTLKGDSLVPNVSNDVVLGQRIKEMNTFKNGWLNIDIVGEAKTEPQWNAVAKTYQLEVSYIVRDDFSSNVFMRALRMEGIITDVMTSYLESVQPAGFMHGEVLSSFTPERVLLGNSSDKAIKSGIVYNLIVH